MDTEWVTTGQAAAMLGVSRQHVVDLCDRGDVPSSWRGTHRRIRRIEIEDRIVQPLTLEQRKSLWLHRAVVGALAQDPDGVLTTARENIAAWKRIHRADGRAAGYLEEWARILDSGIDDVVKVLTSTSPYAVELRQNSPFAGGLSDDVRQRVLRAFRSQAEHPGRAA